jgi:hypothetical protein
MAITVKHKFVSAIPDAGDPTIVQPSNWNDDHDLTGVIPIANGGTNSTATPTAGGVGYGTGTALAYSSAGGSGQFLQSNGTGTPVWADVISNAGSVGYYGAFYDTAAAQTASSTTTAYQVLCGSTAANNGISLASNAVTFTNAGKYLYAFSLQIANPNSSISTVTVWFKVNGVDLPDSAGTYGVPAKHGATNGLSIVGWEQLLVLNAGDVVTMYWQADVAGTRIETLPAGTSPVLPESPAVAINAYSLAQVGIGYYNETSATSTTIGTGSKTFTVTIPVTSTAFTVGTRVRVAYAVTPSNFMEGVITAFTTTSMTVNVDATGGSGTYANWTISVAGIAGANSTVGGSTTQIQYNNAGNFGGVPLLTYNGSTLAMTGSTIDSTVIGGTTPAAGTFTTLTSSGTATLANGSTTYVTITGDASYPMVKATGGTNTPLVLSPLGTGALQAQKTDSTATGGNARGANAVDWQTQRNAAAQVASGSQSFIGGGGFNVASNQYSTIVGGTGNTAGGFAGSIVGGSSNNAGGSSSFIGGGTSNTATSANNGIVAGQSNTAAGYFNFIGGGFTNSGTASAAVTTQATTIAVTAGTTLYLSATNANIKVGQYITGTGVTANTYATSTVTTGTAAVMNTSTISGTTLTVGSLASGTIIAGMVLTGTGVTAGTYIVSGAGSSWTVSTSQTVSSTTITGTAYTFTISQNATTTAGITLSFYTPHGVVVGGGNNQATGAYSFIGGGGDAGTLAFRNTASGDWATIAGGRQNTVSSTYGTVIGGTSNIVNTGADSATIIGGSGCSVSASATYAIAGGNTCAANNFAAIALGGRQNIASGGGSTVIGGSRGTTRSINGMVSLPASYFPIADVSGVQQASTLILGRQTTDATATVLTSDTSAAGTTNQVILPNNSAYAFTATVISTANFALATTATAGSAGTATITFAAQTVAPFIVGQTIVVAGVTPTGYNGTYTVTACTTTTVQYANATTGAQTVAGTVTATSLTKAWKLEGCIMRTSAAAGTRLVGSVTSTVLATDTGTAAWTAVAAADTTNGGLKITFTGAAATTIRTVAQVSTVEVTY